MLYIIKCNVSNNKVNKLTIMYVFIYLYIHKKLLVKNKATKQLNFTYIDHSRKFFSQVKNI